MMSVTVGLFQNKHNDPALNLASLDVLALGVLVASSVEVWACLTKYAHFSVHPQSDMALFHI